MAEKHPLDGERRLGETHCDQCGEWRVLNEEGVCVFCERHEAEGDLRAAVTALEIVRAVVRTALEGNANPADLRHVVEEEVERHARHLNPVMPVDDLCEKLHAFYDAGVY